MAISKVAFCFLAGGSAIRTTRSATNATEGSRVKGAAGTVEAIYTFGSPGSASPGLQNTRASDPCFGGVRVWHEKAADTDMVTWALNVLGYGHAWMPARAIRFTDLAHKHPYSCSEETSHLPEKGGGNFDIHSPQLYDTTREMQFGADLQSKLHFAIQIGYEKDLAKASKDAQKFGWRLVGSGSDDGKDSVIVGAQVSHLLQHPETHECMVTFMGTGGMNDWMGNLAGKAIPFCGLSLAGEDCGNTFGSCTTDKHRGSFAHHGFTQKLREMVESESWQKNVRANLPSCSKVSFGGQSAGSAMSELFAACVANAPAEGEFGYDDYKLMSWNNGKVQLMSSIA